MILCQHDREVRKIRTLTIRLEDDLHKLFKIYSINKNKDMQTILIEHIKKILKEDSQDSNVKK